MAFDQSTFALVGAHSADTPKLYSYKTNDTLAAVTASGYFNLKRFELSPGDIILNDISGSFHIIVVLTATPTVVTSQEQLRIPTKQLTVNKLSDFPAASGGVIITEDNTFYLVGDNLAPSADRWQLGQDTVIAGLDSSVSSLTYTGTGDMFTAVDTSNKITLLTLDCPNGTLHNITKPGAGVAVFQLINCTVDSCDIVGILDNLTAIQYTDVAFNDIKTNGITFVGTIPVFIGNTDLVTMNGSSGVLFDLNTAVFDDFSIDASSVSLVSGAVFLSGLASSGNISSGNLGSVTGIKITGAGTPLSGITTDDIRWIFDGNDDIPNTARRSTGHIIGNAELTTIIASSTPVKVNFGTGWIVNKQSQWTSDNTGTHTYNGPEQSFNVNGSIFAENALGNNKKFRWYIAINGTIDLSSVSERDYDAANPGSVGITAVIDVVTGDEVDLFVENITDTTNMTAATVNLVLEG